MKVLLQIATLLLGLASLLNAQTSYQLASSEMTIAGTSSMHDWESKVNDVQITGKFVLNANAVSEIPSLQVTIPVKGIKSSKGSIMDNKTYNALQKDEHPNITYRLTKVNSINTTADGMTINATGVLKIAGVEKTIDLTVTGKVLANGHLEFQASKKLKMTDFKIDPPTAMFGALKTGDDITIKFKVALAATKS